MSDRENIKVLNELAKKLDKATGKYLYGDNIYCSFCGKDQSQVEQMLSGPGDKAFICNKCIIECQHMLEKEEEA